MFLLLLARKLEHRLATAKFITACLSTLTAIFLPAIAISQPITSDGSTGTIVTPDNNANPPGNSSQYNITGGQLSQDGTNLFHSFSQFGVEARQTANFVVPDPSILNILGRVTGGDPSVINGLIQVTGGNPNLFLLNPAGIVFGTDARLNVPADFTATTATRIGFGNNNWFNAVGTNDYSALIGTPSAFAFGTSGTPGAIINAGELAVAEGKNLALLGGTVINTGQVIAPGGNITVAAVPGQNLIRISQAGHLLNLEIQPCGNTSNCTLPSNSGTDTGTAPLLPTPLSLPELLTGTASNQATDLTVDAEGQVVLSKSGLVVPQSPGTVLLSGTADASRTTPSQIGGSVQLRGNLVGLVEKAQVDVSGDAGGGRVLIGGDVGGQGTAPNELRTVVGPEVTINANAKPGSAGNGGQVKIWADTTRFLGQISAQGGTTGGSGGFVEISGSKNLTFSGTVDTFTQNAGRGTLFLNSANFTLTDAPAVSAAQNRNLADNPQFLVSDNNTGSNTISWGQIAELTTKNNIVLQSTGQIAIADIVGNTPSVTQNNGVNLGPKPGNLTFRSTERSILFQDSNDTIQTSGSNITLEAADKITAGNFLTNGGAVTLRADKDSLSVGQINTSSSSSDGGKVTLNAAKDITVNSIDTRSLSNGTGGSVDITTSGLFRATGKNSSNISIATDGGTRGGSVNIRHGGGSLSVPFTVGSDYNGINGTAGAISTGTGNQIPAGVFAGSYSQGSSPSDIQIMTSGNKTPVVPQLQVNNSSQQTNSPQQTTSSPQPQSNFNQTPLSTSSSSPPVEIDIDTDTGFVELEESFTQEFEQHFGRTFNVETQNVAQANETLEEIDRVTGIKPAFIYAVFVPTTLETPATESPASRATDELELLLVTAQGKPIRKRVAGATRARVLKIAQEFRSNVTNLRSRDYLSSSQQLHKWLIAPLEAELQTQKIDNLVFVLDSGLRSIPLAALYDGREFLVERYSVAMMPSLSLTDTRYRNIQNSQVLAMGAEQFPDQKPLPAVPLELSLITEQLWQGEAFLNKAFTLENLKAQRRQESFGIIHLATHADFLPGKPENSYIQLSNGKLRLNQIPELNWSQPPVELLVLSACRTALGNEQAELGFAGLAVQAGVKSAVASLWLVNDEATLGLMTQFYKQLKGTPIKAEALRQAQLAMLKGQVRIESGKLYTTQGEVTLPPALANLGDQELRHPYYWAAFTLIGNPW